MPAPLRFRAWHREQKKMYSPEEMGADELTLAVDGRGLVNVSGDNTVKSQYAGELMTVMQCTGRNDEAGQEIFEGDIVSFLAGYDNFEYEHHGIVTWLPDMAGFAFEERLSKGSRLYYYEDTPTANRAVIGNIYENPELLKP